MVGVGENDDGKAELLLVMEENPFVTIGSGLLNVMLGSNAGADFLPDFLLGSVWTFCLTGSAAMHRQPAQEKPAREKQGKQ